MRTVTLQFKDLRDLQRFMQLVSQTQLEVSYNSLVLTCQCNEAEIELSLTAFNAQIIDQSDVTAP